MLNIIY